MTPRAAGRSELLGRLSKAEQFSEAAQMIRDLADSDDEVADAYVTLAVHSGIAACDVICIARLGEYTASGEHRDAIKALKRAGQGGDAQLARLLSLKSKAGYNPEPASGADVRDAERAHQRLLEIARLEA